MVSLVAVIVAALFAAGSTAALVLPGVWTCVVTLLWAGGVPALALRLRRLAFLAAVIVALNALAVPGRAALAVFGHRVLSVEGIVAGVFFSIRLAVMYLSLAALTTMVAPESLARGAAALVRPVSARFASAVAFHSFLAMSFVPLFAEEFSRIRMAQSFRVASGRSTLTARAGAVRVIVVPLILSAIRRSEQLAMVVELRGLRDRLGRERVASVSGAGDYAFAIVTLAVICAAVLT